MNANTPRRGRQAKIKFAGRRPVRWVVFMQRAATSIAARGDWTKNPDPFKLLAEEIVASGDAHAFLMATRRGRSTSQQNIRYLLMREVEMLVGEKFPRRREDANTPEAQPQKIPLELEAFFPK